MFVNCNEHISNVENAGNLAAVKGSARDVGQMPQIWDVPYYTVLLAILITAALTSGVKMDLELFYLIIFVKRFIKQFVTEFIFL